ncbi:MAG: bifunctional 5,10-methylenetetrahydrofolate dehydrogenase/5,10-methenyltetrahydrofolate cyclohydrolase [Chloroflexi bacterium]|nr:bifunctional 5,10-methylenetetrahydrofolate dehydrogenase/5,10-methenyltetrahydrofolate cyclohydrolase [Chloroflexota bacterium]
MLLDGRPGLEQARAEVSEAVRAFVARHGRAPGIAVLRVGNDPASDRYARQIDRLFRSVGMGARVVVLDESASPDAALGEVRALNADAAVSGILIQFPMPPHLSRDAVVDAVAPEKDVDGVHPLNLGRLLTGRGPTFIPATPLGGIELLRHYGCPMARRYAVVVGRSEIVGKPLALLLLQEQATVTICHSRTPDLARFTREAEILAVAVGRPGLVRGDMVREGAVVLDFGMNVVDGKLVGDVDYESARERAGAITPVPGGTGPMTNATLLRNTLRAAEWLSR